MRDNADLTRNFTRIPNHVVEAFCTLKIGQHESRVTWAVIRKTYGWNKNWDRISTSQISKATGLDKRHVSRAIKNLHSKNILLKDAGQVSLNQASEEWGVPGGASVPREAPLGKGSLKGTGEVPEKARGSAAKDDKVVPLTAHNSVPREAPQQTHPKTKKDLVTKDKPKDSCGEGRNTPHRNSGNTTPLTTETWQAYAKAYEERYGAPPLRNQTVNGQLTNFVKRVGKDLAPLVAAYYVTLNNRWYVQKGHSVGAMLADAEKLATEFRTNRSVTDAAARQADSTATNLSVFQELLEEERAKNGRE